MPLPVRVCKNPHRLCLNTCTNRRYFVWLFFEKKADDAGKVGC